MYRYISVLSAIVILSSCNNTNDNKVTGHIVLGDSSTIVTENDPKYLVNNFDDLTIKSSHITSDSSTPTQTNKDSNVTSTPEVTPITKEGYKLILQNVTLLLDGITDKDVRKVANNSYVLKKNVFPAKVVTEGNGYIKSRFVTTIYFFKDKTRVKLNDLGEFRTEWVQNNARNNIIQFETQSNKPSFKNVNTKELQNAINNAVTKLKIPQKEKNQLVSDLKNIKSTEHTQVEVVIEKIEWDVLINNKSDKLYFTF